MVFRVRILSVDELGTSRKRASLDFLGGLAQAEMTGSGTER
jgi:hypothetical protein